MLKLCTQAWYFKTFPGLTDAFPGLTDAFPQLTDAFPRLTDAFPGLTAAFPDLTDIFLRLRRFSGNNICHSSNIFRTYI